MPNDQKNTKVDKYNICGNIIHVQSSNKKLLRTIRKYYKPFYIKKYFLKPSSFT